MNEIWLEGTRGIGVVLFHAYTGTPADVNFLAKELNVLGYSVLCPVFTGHGTGDIFDILRATPQMWWEDAQNAIRKMFRHVNHVLVFGLSMGGMYAARVLVDSEWNVLAGGSFNSPIVRQDKLNLDAPFMAYAKFLYTKQKKMTQFAQDEAEILSLHRQQLAEIESFTHSYQGKLTELEKPYYIAQSAKDELINPEDAYELQNVLENARISFHWFSDNTHVITVNPNRKDFEESVIRFIELQTESLN